MLSNAMGTRLNKMAAGVLLKLGRNKMFLIHSRLEKAQLPFFGQILGADTTANCALRLYEPAQQRPTDQSRVRCLHAKHRQSQDLQPGIAEQAQDQDEVPSSNSTIAATALLSWGRLSWSVLDALCRKL